MLSQEMTPQVIDLLVHTAVKYAKETTVAGLGTHIFAMLGVVVTQDELAAICKRLDYFVTSVVQNNRNVRVVRRTNTTRVRPSRMAYVGKDLSGLFEPMLDQLMKVGDSVPTSTVYPTIRERFTEGKSLSSNKITRSLDGMRYRVATSSVDGKTQRCVSGSANPEPRLAPAYPYRLRAVGGFVSAVLIGAP